MINFQPETLKARKLMSIVLKCPESDLDMTDGEVGIPSQGISGIRVVDREVQYSISWRNYSQIRLDGAWYIHGMGHLSRDRIRQIDTELIELQQDKLKNDCEPSRKK